MAIQPSLNRNKTHGYPAITEQKPNTWLSSHHWTETKHMAIQPSLNRNKTHGYPATTLQKQNTWLSSHHSHHPTETKHMAFQPSLNRNKRDGFPATSKQTETKHMATQPSQNRNKTHGYPATTSRNSSFFFPKRYGWSLYGKCLLRGLWLSSQCKIQRFRPPISSFQPRQYPSWHHSEACPSASSRLSHSSSHP